MYYLRTIYSFSTNRDNHDKNRPQKHKKVVKILIRSYKHNNSKVEFHGVQLLVIGDKWSYLLKKTILLHGVLVESVHLQVEDQWYHSLLFRYPTILCPSRRCTPTTRGPVVPFITI